MSSGIGGGISGGVAAGRGGGRGGGGTHRKISKKFGKNLNKLTKAPVAPPVPVVSAGSGGGSIGSFRGSSSSRNGLLLLSTKSKSSGCSSGLLAASGSPKTAHDALLLSAGAGGRGGGEVDKKAAAPAWGIREKKQAGSSPEKMSTEKASGGSGNEMSELTLDRKNPALQQRLSGFPAVHMVTEKVEMMGLNKTGLAKKEVVPDPNEKTVIESPMKKVPDNGATANEKPRGVVEAEGNFDQVKDAPYSKLKFTLQKEVKVKDKQVEYMSKLAKERAEKLRLEEEKRMAAQRERAAKRLRELEEKRLEEKKNQEGKRLEVKQEEKRLQEKKQEERRLDEKKNQDEKWLEEKKKQLLLKSQARKELSKPQVILEPLGKSNKKDTADSSSLKPTSKTPNSDKNNGRTMYDPDRPFSSLVGGKTTKSNADKLKIHEESPHANTKKLPVIGPASALHGKPSFGQSTAENQKDDNSPPPVHMVQLDNLDELDRGGRGGGQAGPRMLFDPTSGSMVAAPTKEEKSSLKKLKQKGPQKSPTKYSDDVDKLIARRSVDGGVASENSPELKPLRGKQGRGGRKDESVLLHQKNKKSVDSKGRQRQTRRKRIPRTCGVLYKMDKSGNYVNADGCEPDNGYGSHHVPGGKVMNTVAHAKWMKQQEEQTAASEPARCSIPATEGFSFRNDPGFIQHQTDFEAQQQKILEDAWASLVEHEEPKEEDSDQQVAEVPGTKSGDDEYAAALAISPSMIGLNFDTNHTIESVMLPPAIKATANSSADEPIDLAKFALEAASSASASNPGNPFSPLGVSGAGLWGTGTGANTSLSDLGALTGWDATPFAETDSVVAAGSTGLTGSSSASKLHLWGSSTLDALDDSGIGVFGNNSDISKD